MKPLTKFANYTTDFEYTKFVNEREHKIIHVRKENRNVQEKTYKIMG